MSALSPRWNAGRAVGPRSAFTPEQIWRLTAAFEMAADHHDLALVTTGVDTMLRASDLLRLQVRDVQRGDGSIRHHLVWRQQKTGTTVIPAITDTARAALRRWITASGKTDADYLFTRRKGAGAPITPSTYRRTVKTWAVLIELDPTDYSSHSVRRSKPVFMYRAGCPIGDIAKMLGHRSADAALHYLGLTTEHLHRQALKYDIFAEVRHDDAPENPKTRSTSPDPVKKKR